LDDFSICDPARAAILSRANVSPLTFSRVPRRGGRRCAAVVPGGRVVFPSARFAFVVLVLPSLVGCTEFAPGDDVLTTSDGRLLDGDPAEGEDWRCVTPESVATIDADLVMPAQQSVRINQSFQFLTLGTGIVPASSSVRVCSRADVNCEQPLADGFTLDADGWVTLPLFVGFDGYVEIRAEGVLPTMLYVGEPLQRAILPGVSGATGTVQNDTSGLLVIRVFDCEDVSASGVSFSQRQEGVEWYYVDGLPSSLANETGSEGLGGFINTPPGVSTIETFGRSGEPLASRKSVAVRADWMTALRMWIGEEAADAD
jgi:hypothetical protein